MASHLCLQWRPLPKFQAHVSTCLFYMMSHMNFWGIHGSSPWHLTFDLSGNSVSSIFKTCLDLTHFFSTPLDPPGLSHHPLSPITGSYVSIFTGLLAFCPLPLAVLFPTQEPVFLLKLSQIWYSFKNLPVLFCSIQSKNQSPYFDLQGLIFCPYLLLLSPSFSLFQPLVSFLVLELPNLCPAQGLWLCCSVCLECSSLRYPSTRIDSSHLPCLYSQFPN